MGETTMTLEERFAQSLEALGLEGWVVALIPREGDRHVQTIMEEKVICLFDEDSAEALTAFKHEVMKIAHKLKEARE